MASPHDARRWRLLLVLLALLGLTAAACGDDDDAGAAGEDRSESQSDEPVTLRLGYFPNITHAPALVGDYGGLFEEAVGADVAIETTTFNAGPEAIEALAADALDVSFLGPNPAINAFARDHDLLRIVAGSTSGGAFLVVKDGIDAPGDLAGTTLATPQLGNTQDVALRAWLQDQGYETDESGGGDVAIQPQANAEALAAFLAGDLDGAWVPEPWATRFVQEGGAHVLVDEADLWPDGEYVTTHLVVRTAFLDEHPDVVRGLIEGLAAAVDLIDTDAAQAKALTNQGIEEISGKALGQAVLDAAWENLHFTLDPIASSLQTSAEDAEAAGLLDPVDLTGIYDLALLNEVLAARGEPAVEALG